MDLLNNPNASELSFILIFMAFGVAIALFAPLRLLYIRSKYLKVSATCVDVKESTPKGDDVLPNYMPIWEYEYEGEKYTSSVGYYQSGGREEIGAKKDIYILPKNPNKIYTTPLLETIGITVFGLVWIGVSLPFFFAAI